MIVENQINSIHERELNRAYLVSKQKLFVNLPCCRFIAANVRLLLMSLFVCEIGHMHALHFTVFHFHIPYDKNGNIKIV